MADVFISYAREDRDQAEHIARGLGALGLDAFWDTEIPPGQTWADYIESKLTDCKSVIVLWSVHSTKSQWVREEARMGRERAKLIPVMLDNSQPPFGFGEVQAADLSSWNGDYNAIVWTRFAQAVYRTARGSEPLTPPAPSMQTQSPPQAPPTQSSGWQTDPPPAYAAPASAAQLSPIGYIQKCFRLYFDGKGRARRSEYGWFTALQVVATILLVVVDVSLFGLDAMGNPNYAFSWLVLALLPPGVSAASRRLHDLNLNGWLAAVTLIPYVGWLAILALIFVPGQPGANAYGENPKSALAV